MTREQITEKVEALFDVELALDERLVEAEGRTNSKAAGEELVQAMLAGSPADQHLRALASAETEADALVEAITSARRQRAELLRELNRIDAAALREQAAVIEREAEEREAKLRKLLAAASEFEGVEFEQRMQRVQGDVRVPAKKGKTAALREQAWALRNQAVETERVSVFAMGFAEDANPDVIVERLRGDAFQVGVAAHEVRAWIRDQEARPKSGEVGRTERWVFTVRSSNGAIELKQSGLHAVAPARRIA